MKKTLSIFCILFAFVVFSGVAQSQITVSGSTGANGSYTSLTDAGGAFLAINSSVQTGNNIVILVTGDALAETGANSLNASDWASVTIFPLGGAARTISGSFTGALINLNGADNVTINGLNTGGNSLTIANTATGASSTIQFIADASNNTIANCSILGSSTASVGVVNFSTGTTTGNDANSISNCNIGPAGSNLPLYGIQSLGTSAIVDNSGNTVSGNNIYDYFSATSSSRGINLGNFNSGWTITNNKFYQTANRIYTSANTHYGIIISQGSGYTITDNIIGYANSGGTGTTNMVGLTSGSLGGTFPSSYTVGGTANATRFVGINCSFLAGGAASSIQNNTIAGFALYTSSGATTTNGILCGIAVTSGTANIGTVTGNNINSLYSATTSTGGAIVGIYTSTTTGNTINIQNNSISALDAMGTTASISGGITCINTTGTLGSYNISNNIIGNTTNPNLRMGNLTESGNLSNTGTTFSAATGTSAFRGILNAANGTVTIGQNTVKNANQNSTSTSSLIRGIEQTASTTTGAGILTITGNTIQNLTTASTNSSLSAFSNYTTASGIIVNGSLPNPVVTLNNISQISLSNTTTAGTNVAGIAIAQSNNPVISRNTIFDLSNASTSTNALTPGSISGILIRSGSSTVSPVNVVNNMISLGTSQTTNTCIVGIWGNHGQTTDPSVTNIYYNSVHITGTVSSGAQPSFGYLRGDLSTTARTTTVDIRNNIFNNERTGGTGSHYAISNNFGATASATGWIGGASNFNVLNSASSSTVGYWTTDRTLASWQSVSGSDLVSISGVSVVFVNAAAGDLHLNFGVTPTQLESAGFVIPAYTTDFDNQTRPGPAGSVNSGATNPDLGADEFDGVPLDITKPSITYIPLGISACLTSRVLTANIFDGTGINVSPGLKPRVYYKKASNLNSLPATNDNTTDGWKYAEASNASSPFSFTIDYSIIFGGVASGDAIEYFVVAQDLASTPNVGENVATFTLAPTSVALIAGNFPVSGTNAYNLTTGLTGTVTIGASGTFTSITGTGGLFEAINNNGIDGNLIAEILDASIAETGATALNPMQTGCSPSYSLTIRPATGVTTVVSGSSTTPLIDLNGADFVTIDGSNSGSSSKDMTIRNTGTGATIRLIGGAVNDTLRNCIIESQNTATTSGTVFFSTATGTGVATGNSNNVINNCDIRDRSDIAGVPANAVYSEGTNTLPNAGNKISGCNVFNFTNTGVLIATAGAGDGWVINPSSFYQTAARTTNITFISILGGNGHSIVNNSIGGSAPNAGGSFFSSTARIIGINLNVGSTTTTSIQGNTIKNMRTTGTENNMIYAGSGSSLLDIGSVSGNIIGSSDTTERLQFSGQALTGSSGIRVVSSSLLIVNNNVVNNIHITNPNEGSGLRGIDLEASSSGSCIVENNTVTNILNSGRGSGNFSIGPSTTAGLSVFVRGINTIRGNSISKIINTSAIPSVSTNVFGLLVLQSSAGTIVEKNIITELSGSTVGTGTLATSIVGLQTSSSAVATVVNNLISLDGGSSSDRIIVGINEQSGTNGAVNFYYNTVNIYGTSTGSNNTFAFNRSSFARAPVVLRNNVFSNARVAATGSNIALANEVTSPNTAIGWPSGASEHNALHSLNPATLTKWGATIYDLSGYQSVSGCDLYTFAGDPGFTSNTNLIPDASNVNCWTLNGNGIALNDVATDILGNPRSTSIFTGGTDIGAYEFDATVLPPNYNNATGAPGTYRFIHRLDTMATINVTTLGTLADLNVKYFSGEVPPGVASNNPLTFGNGDVYWEISPTDLSNTDYTYDLTLHYSPALTGTITNERNIKVAKNNGVDTFYVPFLIEGTGPGQYQIDTSKNNITVYGLTEFSRFILTDGDIPQPVELSSFTASVNRRDVNLNWSTSTETNNSGFDVERRITGGEWLKVASVNGNGTTTSPKDYSYTDKNLSSGSFSYRLKQTDFNGNFTYFEMSNEVNIGLPTRFELSQNYPNPFNPTTKINYDLPVDGKVSIALYDISGREVAKLVNEVKTAGYYIVQFNASNLSSGTYFYRISAEGKGQKFNDTKKMVLIK